MFEAKQGYKGVGRPTTSGRPEVVSQWISRAWSVTWRPNILDVKGYEAKYNEWWKRLQPDWRVVNGQVDVGLTQGNWESLRLPGLNGFLSKPFSDPELARVLADHLGPGIPTLGDENDDLGSGGYEAQPPLVGRSGTVH